MFLPHPRVKVNNVESLRDREVACSASDRQGSSFESCVWRTVSYHSSHHPQEVLLAQFSLYVHKGGLKPDSFHFIWYEAYASKRIFYNKHKHCPGVDLMLSQRRRLFQLIHLVYCQHFKADRKRILISVYFYRRLLTSRMG